MLPRTHILLGFIFTILLKVIFPEISFFYLGIVWFASIFIDFDHYVASVMKTGKISLFKSFEYHNKMGVIQASEKKRGIKRKGDFHLFHTIEFHLLILLLGVLFWEGFYYLFVGMIFHSFLDVISLTNKGLMYRREFFFVCWLFRKFNQ